MAVDEARRVRLFERLQANIGEEATATLFEILPASGHEVATKADVEALGASLRAEIAELRAELRAGHHELVALFRGELNAALAHNTRTMLAGLVGTLMSTLGLAAVLARFVA